MKHKPGIDRIAETKNVNPRPVSCIVKHEGNSKSIPLSWSLLETYCFTCHKMTLLSTWHCQKKGGWKSDVWQLKM